MSEPEWKKAAWSRQILATSNVTQQVQIASENSEGIGTWHGDSAVKQNCSAQIKGLRDGLDVWQ